MNRRHLLALAAAAPALALPPAELRAQSFDRPRHFVGPFVPGGTSDILARIPAPELTRLPGQNVVVENRSGTAETVTWGRVVRANNIKLD